MIRTAFQVVVVGKNPLPMQEIWDKGSIPGSGKIPWSRKWQTAPVFLPGKFHGQRSLVGYSQWSCKRVGHNWAHMLAITRTYDKGVRWAIVYPYNRIILSCWKGRWVSLFDDMERYLGYIRQKGQSTDRCVQHSVFGIRIRTKTMYKYLLVHMHKFWMDT